MKRIKVGEGRGSVEDAVEKLVAGKTLLGSCKPGVREGSVTGGLITPTPV